MNDRLREAIAVARSGETQEAQLLVAAILDHSPDNAQAWYLMSHLVESPARQAAYLYKAVSLDPYHERAKAELARFPSAVTETLANSFNTSASANVVEPENQNGSISDIPEWLRSLTGETPQRQPVLASADDLSVSQADDYIDQRASTTAVTTTRPAKRRQKRDGLLITVLVVLAIVTLVVLGLLSYLLFFQM